MTYEEKIERLRNARNILHKLEDRGTLENNLSMEQIIAIRVAEYALDELCESKDVQPVKCGRWVITDDVEHFIAICSECGRTEDSRGIKDMPYCHCGARMDGEQND